jgi:hypothetical protein
MIQRTLRVILQDSELRRSLIQDMASVPAMMYLFGRPGQGDFNKHFNSLMGIYGEGEEGLSYDEQSRHFKPGRGGSKGKDSTASRLMALAHRSGLSDDDPERSNLSNHSIDSKQLNAFGVRYDERLMGQVERFRGIIEALADHQAESQGLPVKMPIGDIKTEPARGMQFADYPEEGVDATLDSHMEAYLHPMANFAESTAMPIRPSGDTVAPESPASALSQVPVSSPPPSGATPLSPVAVRPQGPPATPLYQPFQNIRPQIADLDAQRFRQMMTAGGSPSRNPNLPPEEFLTPIERRAQQSLSDPRQQLLSQYMKAEDAHLPVMDRVMKALERMQQEEAGFDGIKINSNLNNPHALAKHVGLTASEVVTINQTMGDWHNIAKSYNVDAKIIKVIKTNMG